MILRACFCPEALGMNISTVAVAEQKREAQRFMERNFDIPHMFEKARDLTEPGEPCLKCRGKCNFKHQDQPSLTTAGLPCQPFSKMRACSGAGAPRKHKDFATYEEFGFYLDKRRPQGFIVEEVSKILGHDRTEGRRWIDMFMEDAALMGYGCSAIRFNRCTWSVVPRDRLHFAEFAIVRLMGSRVTGNAGRVPIEALRCSVRKFMHENEVMHVMRFEASVV